MRRFAFILALTLLLAAPMRGERVLVFITLGQSNADGSAFPDPQEDARLQRWFAGEENPHHARMWYRACCVSNEAANAVGDEARIVVDAPADKRDAEPGWMELWYMNDQPLGRTAMNMIHSCGTWSRGAGKWTAQGRRGMEPQLGLLLQQALPETQIYFLKLGASGSHISAWANPADDRNWLYFLHNIYEPAMAELRGRGLEPEICGVWWMQGCADAARDADYYAGSLRLLVERLSTQLCTPNPPIFIGHVVKPGENPACPDASRHFGQGVRDAQEAVAAEFGNVETIDTSVCSFQYEKGFGGHLHIDHRGQCRIAELLAPRVLERWSALAGTQAEALMEPLQGDKEDGDYEQ